MLQNEPHYNKGMQTTSYIYKSNNVRIFDNGKPAGPTTYSSRVQHEEGLEPNQILELIFAACNRGSGSEDPIFLKTHIPSISINDVVTLVDTSKSYVCDFSGWEEL
jgi:hypothetical protein